MDDKATSTTQLTETQRANAGRCVDAVLAHIMRAERFIRAGDRQRAYAEAEAAQHAAFDLKDALR